MSKYFTEDQSEKTAIDRMNCEGPRFDQIMTSLIKHLHAFVKDIEPTNEEWGKAIKFLTETGHITDDKRQEWVLLSDTLGVSMLVDAIVNRSPSKITESTVLGPFFLDGVQTLPMGANIAKAAGGEKTIVKGRVLDTNGNPIAGARMNVWQGNHEGFYDIQQPDLQPEKNLRGVFVTDSNGEYSFETIKPVPYPIPADGPVGKMLIEMGRHPYRPSHIHFIIEAEGYKKLVTHLFASDSEYLDSDTVFGVKESLIIDFEKRSDAFYAEHDFVLAGGN